MKIIALILSLSITANAFAAGLSSDLESTVNDFHYALTVEWDQKDQAFADQKTTEFFNNLESLMAAGLTSEEITAFAQIKMKDEAALEALKIRAEAVSPAGQEELLRVFAEESKSFYGEGASWNGAAVAFYGGFGLLIFGVIAYSAWFNANYECVEYELRRHNVCVDYDRKE